MKKIMMITGIFSAIALSSFTACSTKRTAKNTEPLPAPTPVVESSMTTMTPVEKSANTYPLQRYASLGASSSGRSR